MLPKVNGFCRIAPLTARRALNQKKNYKCIAWSLDHPDVTPRIIRWGVADYLNKRNAEAIFQHVYRCKFKKSKNPSRCDALGYILIGTERKCFTFKNDFYSAKNF